MLIAQLDALHRSRGGDWYYRTFAPGRAMAGAPGVYVVNLDQGHRKLGQVLAEADVLVLNGACSADLLPVVQERKREKRVTLFEINDDVEAMPPANKQVISGKVGYHVRDGGHNMLIEDWERFMTFADEVWR